MISEKWLQSSNSNCKPRNARCQSPRLEVEWSDQIYWHFLILGFQGQIWYSAIWTKKRWANCKLKTLCMTRKVTTSLWEVWLRKNKWWHRWGYWSLVKSELEKDLCNEAISVSIDKTRRMYHNLPKFLKVRWQLNDFLEYILPI